MLNTIKITDKFLVLILFITMAIFSIASVVTLRNVSDQTEGLKNSVEKSRFNSETASFCVLKVSGQINFKEIPYTAEAIITAVDACFKEREQDIVSPLPPIPQQ